MDKLAVITPGEGSIPGQGITNPTLGGLGKLTGEQFFASALPAFVGVGFLIGVLYFFFMMIWGAIAWISAGGDKQALESARGRLTNAIIGIIILFAAFALIRVIETFFHISILTIDISGLVIQ